VDRRQAAWTAAAASAPSRLRSEHEQVRSWLSSRSDKEFDIAGRLLRQQARCVFSLLARNDVGVAGSQEPTHDPTGRRTVVDTARILAAEILHGATKPFGLEEMQHELGVLSADWPVADRVA